MKRLPGSLLLVTALLVGCPVPSETPVPALEGRVQFPDTRRTQATITEIADAATVSLIDVSTNSTVGVTLTDAEGRFSLNPSRTWRPETNGLYYMEAVKGLANNQVGADAARVRTVIRYEGSWTSLSAGTVIYLNASTTALALMVGLKASSATPIDAASMIGRLEVGNPGGGATPPDTFPGVANAPSGEFATVREYVASALEQDLDPVAAVSWSEGTGAYTITTNRGPLVTNLTPNTGAAGSEVTLTGARFFADVASNSVTFGGVAGSVLGASTTELRVRVPAGASTGLVMVETPYGLSNGLGFMVLANVTGTFRGQAHGN